jgi:hypothetical protein
VNAKKLISQLLEHTAVKDFVPHFVGQIHLPTHEVHHQMTFQNDEPDNFSAFYQAEEFLKVRKYRVGSMDGDFPIGFVKGNSHIERIAKWTRISKDELNILDGMIVSEDYRNGPVTIAFFDDQ